MFLLLSNWEGLPISIIEAMRSALPIIASNVGSVNEEVFDNINGWLIDRNEKRFVDILKTIYEEKEILQIYGENSRRIYKEKFTLQIMMNEIVKVYGDIIGK